MRRTVLTGVLATGLFFCGVSQAGEQQLLDALARYERATQTVAPPAPADEEATWLAMADEIAEDSWTRADDAKDADGQRAYTPWKQRRGPAYPGSFWPSFGRDIKEFAPMMWDDTKATVTNPFSLVMLAAAGVTGITLSGGGGNAQVQEHFTKRGSQLNTFWDTVGDVGGNPGAHFAFAGALYIASLARHDDRNYEAAKSMLSALAINGIATMGLKVMARTESPNGDEFGWPSGHTSSSFCFAAVMYEHYGPWVGVPLYAFAAFVGYERIDARNHDFADVISGALIGIAIGHAVGRNHQPRVLGMDIVPFTDPRRGGIGIALAKQW